MIRVEHGYNHWCDDDGREMADSIVDNLEHPDVMSVI
jgi:hypothetical protein